MKEYIINIPHLQSLTKRLSNKIISIMCWLMWAYLLLPAVILVKWLGGDAKVLKEMHWFGGQKSLLELLQIYAGTLGLLAIAWLVWIVGHRYCTDHWRPAPAQNVTDKDLCEFYHVDAQQLQQCRKQQRVTVFFDEHGQIVKLE